MHLGTWPVHAGLAEVASGMARRVMVLGVEPSASHLKGADVGALYGLSFDAWSDGMTGIDSTSLLCVVCAGLHGAHGCKP